MEIVVDVVLALAAVAAIVIGWRRGALLTALSMVGLIVGLWVGLLLAPLIVEWLTPLGLTNTVARALLAAVVVLAFGSVLYGVGTTLGSMLRTRMHHGPVGRVDSAGGSVVGVVAWAVVVWLVAGFVQTSSLYPASQLASESRIVAALDAMSPVPASAVLGALDDALAGAGLPEVFSHGETIPGTEAPDSSIPAAVTARSQSVVKVLSLEPSCSMESTGSGWVDAPGTVVTNAHVVAGSSSVDVQTTDGHTYDATVVAFDSQRDVAVLSVPDLGAPALTTGSPLTAGDSAVVAGYPGGGSLTLGGARVRAELTALGTDIYQRDAVARDVYSLRGTVRPGNSGGPLFDSSGRVVGVVFARSTTDSDTGYALTLAEIEPVLKAAGSMPVATGACAAG
ncbi:MAG TPA: MarP family serine protease [Humibacter sp.]|nr:MarP family serine protease [Humibacter sp.]